MKYLGFLDPIRSNISLMLGIGQRSLCVCLFRLLGGLEGLLHGQAPIRFEVQGLGGLEAIFREIEAIF